MNICYDLLKLDNNPKRNLSLFNDLSVLPIDTSAHSRCRYHTILYSVHDKFN